MAFTSKNSSSGLATARTSRWVISPRRNRRSSWRLFCFPYAGGGGFMFRDWCEFLPEFVDVVAVQLPGRENRILEAPFDRISLLVEELYAALQFYFDMPFMFFGHSM